MLVNSISKLCILFSFFLITAYNLARSEETSYSIENNRVLKLLAEAEANRALSPTPSKPDDRSASYVNVSQTYYTEILNEVKELKRIIVRLQHSNFMDELVSKCISSLKRNNENKAKQHWRNIIWKLNTQDTDEDNQLDISMKDAQSSPSIQNEKAAILRRIIIGTYEGIRSNIIPIVQFINHTKIISGFQPLLQEMSDYDHIYAGTEIFLIARLIRLWCGTNSTLYYKELPYGVQYVDSYSVHLLNENNQGLLYYKQKTYCRGRFCSNHELYTFHHAVQDLAQDNSDDNLKSEWTFEPTNATETISATDLRFYMRNGFIPKIDVSDNDTGNGTNSTQIIPTFQDLYASIDYEYRVRSDPKSPMLVALVNNTEDAIRIRVEQSHLVRRLIMGTKHGGGGATFTKLSIMGTNDNWETASDGNWVVLPIRKLSQQVLRERFLWDENVQCQISH